MRRRDVSPEHTLPAELATFDAAVWHDRGGVDGWARARSAWCRAHDGVWPTGDFIDMLKEAVDVKRRLSIETGLRDRAN